jgi:DNA-binding transcriptional LysR family regulator
VVAATNGFYGQLRVALSDCVTPSRLPILLALCRQEEPEVEIRLSEVPLSQQIKGLREDLYDVGFAQSDDVDDGIVATPVWREPLMVAVPARHPLLAHKRIPLEEVLRYPLVLCDPEVSEGHAKQIERVLRKGRYGAHGRRARYLVRPNDGLGVSGLRLGSCGSWTYCGQSGGGAQWLGHSQGIPLC